MCTACYSAFVLFVATLSPRVPCCAVHGATARSVAPVICGSALRIMPAGSLCIRWLRTGLLAVRLTLPHMHMTDKLMWWLNRLLLGPWAQYLQSLPVTQGVLHESRTQTITSMQSRSLLRACGVRAFWMRACRMSPASLPAARHMEAAPRSNSQPTRGRRQMNSPAAETRTLFPPCEL